MVQLFSLVGTLLMIFLCAVFPLLGVPLVVYFALIGLGLIGD
jgi:hypothetical protein